LRGERFGEEVAGGDYVCSLGIGETLREELPERGCLIGDVALPLLRAGRAVLTVPATSELRAPGDSLEDYLAENLAWLRARGESSFVAAGAEVSADVELSEVMVGAGATVGGRGRLHRVVVWPGARVAAPLADAVVTSEGRVVPVTPS
jgi:mannose-1-phosphate guanylyltransferase